MSNLPELSVIVPLFQHGDTVALVHRRLRAFLDGEGLHAEIVLVDDGSDDDTADALRSLLALDAQVVAVLLPRNRGQSAAVVAGLEAARGDILLTTDADLDTGLHAAMALIAAVRAGADLACGARVGRSQGLLRRLGSRLLNDLLQRVAGVAVRDFGCGMSAGSRALLTRWQRQRRGPHVIKLALLALAERVVEVDIELAAVPTHERVLVPQTGARARSRYGAWSLLQLAVRVLLFRVECVKRVQRGRVAGVIIGEAPLVLRAPSDAAARGAETTS